MQEDSPFEIPQTGDVWNKLAPWAVLIGAVLTAVGFILTFTTASIVSGASVGDFELIGGEVISHKLLMSQKIFYFHMPVAITSMIALGFTAYYGFRYLRTKESRFDIYAKSATEMSLVFILCTMVSGEMWERFEWGVWWTWEPRLTTYFILMLLVIGYFILRAGVVDPERRATYASVFGIIAFIDVPICFLITRMIPSSIHPVILRTDSGLSPDMLLPLMLCMFGMFFIAFGLYRFSVQQALLKDRLQTFQDALEERL